MCSTTAPRVDVEQVVDERSGRVENGPNASGRRQPSTFSNQATALGDVGNGDADVVDPEQAGDARHDRVVPFRFGDQSGRLGSRSYAIPFG